MVFFHGRSCENIDKRSLHTGKRYDNVGMGPQQYIIHVRLSMAEHLLRTTEKPILDIAGEVGFHSLSSFNRLFLRAYGCSPRVLRAESASVPCPAEQKNYS